jgi:hypothetical protein
MGRGTGFVIFDKGCEHTDLCYSSVKAVTALKVTGCFDESLPRDISLILWSSSYTEMIQKLKEYKGTHELITISAPTNPPPRYGCQATV